jgi:DNA polymerase-3 subunit delta'
MFAFPKPDDKDPHKLVILSEHPDLGTVIPYNRNILVDAIRHLEAEANFRPYEAPVRIFIIDDADKMNDSASNALLKTLEEPPSTSYIFLITSRPDSLLPTIRSRCQTIRFAPVDTCDIERYLIEDRAYSHDEAKLAASLSRGSIGRAMSADIKHFSVIRKRMLDALNAAVVTNDVAKLLRLSEENSDAKNKANFDESLDILESLVHDVWTLAVSDGDAGLVNADLADELSVIAKGIDPPRATVWVNDIETLRNNLIVNVNKRVATDSLFASMAAG